MGTRVLNLDNVGMSGELHDKVKGLFNVFTINFKINKINRLRFMQLSTQSFIADTWVVTGSSFIE